MENIVNFTKEFEILQQKQTSDGYVFGGYIITFDNELLGHKINSNSDQMRLDRNAEVVFRQDLSNNINLPLTVDHSHSTEGVKGNFFEVYTDSIGVFGRAKTTDEKFASRIKDRTLRNFSSELTIDKFDTRDKIDYITGATLTAVSIVKVPADAKATIREFSVTNNTKITDFSNVLKNLGMSLKESNTFVSKFKEFLLANKFEELDLLKKELNNYKLLEKLRSVR